LRKHLREEKSVFVISVPTAALGNSLVEALQYATAIETTATSKKKAG
jgi:hypothetical protein